MPPTNTDIAWAAGLFEGEGCISIYSKKNQRIPSLGVHLGMTDLDVVKRFVYCVDGDPSRIRVCVDKNGHKTMFRWMERRRPEAERVIRLLLPYMGERRKLKALEALALPKQIRPRKVNGQRNNSQSCGSGC